MYNGGQCGTATAPGCGVAGLTDMNSWMTMAALPMTSVVSIHVHVTTAVADQPARRNAHAVETGDQVDDHCDKLADDHRRYCQHS